ncbi:MAG TPA: hypothetical protein PKJ97_04150, partial [Candidatus Bilamarchaeaceae archaeon]|nr:hypothetical protein [Candidatus Bilamarchaeaceae archaeon]
MDERKEEIKGIVSRFREEPAAPLEDEPAPVEPRERQREKVVDSYSFLSENIPVEITVEMRGGFVPMYNVSIPGIAGGTKLLLETKLRGELITEVKLDITEILDPKKVPEVKRKFQEAA